MGFFCIGEKRVDALDLVADPLKDEMVHYVANFVHFQNPNGGGLPYWPPVSWRNRSFRHFSGKSTHKISPIRIRRKMDHTFVKDKGPM